MTIFSVIALPICTAPPGERLALAGQLGRAEGGPVDAIAPGPSTDGDDPVARLNFLESFAGAARPPCRGEQGSSR